MNKSFRRECAHTWQSGNRAFKQIAQKKSDDPIISLSARTDAEEEKERVKKKKKEEEERDVAPCWNALRRDHYPDTLPISRHRNPDRVVGLTRA